MEGFYGIPVVIFDGTNHEEIVRAFGLVEGDGVIPAFDDHPAAMIKAAGLDELRRDPGSRPNPWLN